MTKTEQNRVLAWRLKVLREARAAQRRLPTNLFDQSPSGRRPRLYNGRLP
jgi:hypothetical protein